MKNLVSYIKADRRDEQGVILILMLILLPVLIILLGFMLTTGWVNTASEKTQTAADSAAKAGAGELKSTRVSMNLSLVSALESIQASGFLGSNSLNAIISDLRSQVGPYNGPNSWTVDRFKITVLRGRWWPHGAPLDYHRAMHPRVENFEPFDNDPEFTADWQTKNKGTPDFIAANAVYTRIEQKEIKSLFVPWESEFKVDGEAVAVGAHFDDEETCVAPFAIPVCSILQDGEFKPETTCDIDRYFTGVNRYCPANNPDCNVLPGTFWEPMAVRTYCDQSNPWLAMPPSPVDNARCNCAQQPAMPPWPGTPGSAQPCAQNTGISSVQANFYPGTTLDGNVIHIPNRAKERISDHFGVVGLSQSALDALGATNSAAAADNEQTYVDLFRTAHQCAPARIGDRFYFNRDGLDDPRLDRLVWETILGERYQRDPQKPEEFADAHPLHIEAGPEGFPDLGHQWMMGRSKNGEEYPRPGSQQRRFLEQVAADTHEPMQVVPANAWQTQPQYGSCNSHRVWYDERCQIRDRNWLVPEGERVSYGRTANVNAPYRNFGRSAWATDEDFLNVGYLNRGYLNKWRSPLGPTDPEIAASKDPWGWVHEDPRLHDGYNGQRGELYYYGEFNARGSGSGSVVQPVAVEFEDGVPFSCDEVPPYLACAATNPDFDPTQPVDTDRGPNRPVRSPENTRVWQVSIPVIAESQGSGSDSDASRACEDILGSVNEPGVNASNDYRVVGFIRAYLFDNDIGKPPPYPPGGTPVGEWLGGRACEPGERNCYSVKNDGTNIPPVCDYSDGSREPWRFDPDADGIADDCNMVRGRIACEMGLIASEDSGLTTRESKIVF